MVWLGRYRRSPSQPPAARSRGCATMMRVCWCSAREVVVPRKTPHERLLAGGGGGGVCRPKFRVRAIYRHEYGPCWYECRLPFCLRWLQEHSANTETSPWGLYGGAVEAPPSLRTANNSAIGASCRKRQLARWQHGRATVRAAVHTKCKLLECPRLHTANKPFQLSQKRRAGNGAPQSVRPLPFAPRDGRHNGRATFAEPGSLALCRSTLHKRVECRQR